MVHQHLDHVGAEIGPREPTLELNGEAARSTPNFDEGALREKTVGDEQVLLHHANRTKLLLRTPYGQLQGSISFGVFPEKGFCVGLVGGHEIVSFRTQVLALGAALWHHLKDRCPVVPWPGSNGTQKVFPQSEAQSGPTTTGRTDPAEEGLSHPRSELISTPGGSAPK